MQKCKRCGKNIFLKFEDVRETKPEIGGEWVTRDVDGKIHICVMPVRKYEAPKQEMLPYKD